MTVQIVFETHSLSTDNEAGGLPPLGCKASDPRKASASRVARQAAGAERIDAIYTSGLRRAVEPAAPCLR
jgi:broad specificity phosphatase PhoE